MAQRIQVQNPVGMPELQATSPSVIQAVQARFDPNSSGAFQLAQQLGALNGDKINELAERYQLVQDNKEAQAAQAYANSMTVEELGKKIDSGEMLPSQSPVFAATVQHIYGSNSQDNIERDTASKIASGQLKFNSQADLDQYLVDQRNQFLGGKSEYTVSGFDKGWHDMRDRLFGINMKVTDTEAQQRALSESSDALANTLQATQQPDYKGTKEDAANQILDQFHLLQTTKLLNPDTARATMDALLQQAATSGDQELVDNLVKAKVPGQDVTVGAYVGTPKATQYSQAAQRQNDQNQHQRVDVEIRPFLDQADKGELDQTKFDDWVSKNERWLTTPTIHAITEANLRAQERLQKANDEGKLLAASQQSSQAADQTIATAAAQGNLAFVPQLQVLTPEGHMENVNMKEKSVAALTKLSSQTNDFGKQVELWSTNSVENPQWQSIIQSGYNNLASVGYSADGKQPGELNKQGQEAIDMFTRVNAVNPAYAKKLAGDAYDNLDDIQFLMSPSGGSMTLNNASALVAQKTRSGITEKDIGAMKANVANAVNKVVNPGFFDGTMQWFRGIWGNDQVNLSSVQSGIRRRAELLAESGQVPNAEAAVKATVEYLASPAVTTKVNNTVYFNQDLPTVPKGESVGDWFGKFITQVPGGIAAQSGIKSSDVRLEPNQYGGYTAWTAGVPLTDNAGRPVTYTKDDVSKWVDGQMKAQRYQKSSDANYNAWKDRVHTELQKMPQDEGNNVSHYAMGSGISKRQQLLSRQSYDQFLKSGQQNKSAQELLNLIQ